MTTPCAFPVSMEKAKCPAFEDARSPRHYCFAHEEIYLHDCAIAYRRKCRKDAAGADRWAERLALPLDRIKALADNFPRGERPIALEVQ